MKNHLVKTGFWNSHQNGLLFKETFKPTWPFILNCSFTRSVSKCILKYKADLQEDEIQFLQSEGGKSV